MGTIIYIIAAAFAVIAVLILGLVITADVIRTKEYLGAARAMAEVNGYAGEHRTSNYGFFQAASKYYGYHVTFMVNSRMYTGIYLSKKKALNEGDMVEVRYITSKDGVTLVNSNFKDRFFRMLFCAAVVIPVCVIYILFFQH